MCQANAGYDHSVPDTLGTDSGIIFHAERHELIISSNHNNSTEMKKILLAVFFCF